MADCVDFGIIQSIDPKKDYSLIDGPEDYKKLYIQYQCVSISDDFVNELIPLTADVPSYLCSLQNGFRGIDHYGVTLFHPQSVKKLKEIVGKYADNMTDSDVKKLITLFDIAIDQKNLLFVLEYK